MRIAFVYMNNEHNVGRGAGYVAAAIIQAGHHVDFYDTVSIPIDVLIADMVAGHHDVLMISTMTMSFPQAVILAGKVKRLLPMPILLGGIHPTIVGASILRENDCFDYLCIGEGESMVVEFLDKLKSGLTNPVRAAEDLSLHLDFPWQLFPKTAIVQKPHGFCYVNASRGCPYDCTYCCNGKYLEVYRKNYLRYRPVDSVIKELLFLKKMYKPRLFYFGDEMILAKPLLAEELFRRIQHEVKVPYGLMCSVVMRISEESISTDRCQTCKSSTPLLSLRKRRYSLHRIT